MTLLVYVYLIFACTFKTLFMHSFVESQTVRDGTYSLVLTLVFQASGVESTSVVTAVEVTESVRALRSKGKKLSS